MHLCSTSSRTGGGHWLLGISCLVSNFSSSSRLCTANVLSSFSLFRASFAQHCSVLEARSSSSSPLMVSCKEETSCQRTKTKQTWKQLHTFPARAEQHPALVIFVTASKSIVSLSYPCNGQLQYTISDLLACTNICLWWFEQYPIQFDTQYYLSGG